jgi:hypothetical protein
VLPLRANDVTLPVEILQAARVGRRTIVPAVPGVRTWERAVHVADGGVAFTDAIASFAGARAAPDAELRGWALGLTAERLNAPLWARLRALGVVEDQLPGRDGP